MAQTSHPAGRNNWWELGGALVMLLLGGYMLWRGIGYSVGSLNRIGPGFFPVAVGVCLIAISVAIALEVRFSDTSRPRFRFRPLTAIILGLLAFAVLVESAGLIPATFVLVLVSAFGDQTMSPLRAMTVATAIAALGYVVFIIGFRLPIDPFW